MKYNKPSRKVFWNNIKIWNIINLLDDGKTGSHRKENIKKNLEINKRWRIVPVSYTHLDVYKRQHRKRRITFHGHVQRMNPDRVTEKLFNYFKKLKMSNMWFKEAEKDIEELQIIQEDTEER